MSVQIRRTVGREIGIVTVHYNLSSPCLRWSVHFFQLASQFCWFLPPFPPHYNVTKNRALLCKRDFCDIVMGGKGGAQIGEIARQTPFKLFIFGRSRCRPPRTDLRDKLKKMYRPPETRTSIIDQKKITFSKFDTRSFPKFFRNSNSADAIFWQIWIFINFVAFFSPRASGDRAQRVF